jgi:hypothetical protein
VIDWYGYALLRDSVPLQDFLDLEELSIVARDRASAWESFRKHHPELYDGVIGPPAKKGGR